MNAYMNRFWSGSVREHISLSSSLSDRAFLIIVLNYKLICKWAVWADPTPFRVHAVNKVGSPGLKRKTLEIMWKGPSDIETGGLSTRRYLTWLFL